MSLSSRIASQLPILRRYARAMTGSQLTGDACVAEILEILTTDASLYPVAEVLDTDESDVERLLAEASDEVARQLATRVMIIEDEPLIAMDIRRNVESLGHTVTGIARTRDEAVGMFSQDQPKLILADIKLADGSSGLEAVNALLREHEIAVIFVTTYPEKLLTGKRPEPAFIMTKPFDAEMLRGLISQVLFFDSAAVEPR